MRLRYDQIGLMPKKTTKRSDGYYLADHRDAAGMTLQQVADAINELSGEPTQTTSTISRFERERPPKPAMLRMFAEVYGVSVGELSEPPRSVDLNRHLKGKPADLWERADRVVAALVDPTLGGREPPPPTSTPQESGQHIRPTPLGRSQRR